MQSEHLSRRRFVARAALGSASVAGVTLAGASAVAHAGSTSQVEGEFLRAMEEAGAALRTLRRSLPRLESTEDARAMSDTANRLVSALVRATGAAGEVSIPQRAAARYEGRREEFIVDLRKRLIDTSIAALTLHRSLLIGDTENASREIEGLLAMQTLGHDEFMDD